MYITWACDRERSARMTADAWSELLIETIFNGVFLEEHESKFSIANILESTHFTQGQN